MEEITWKLENSDSFVEAEKKLWVEQSKILSKQMTLDEINEKYENGEQRIVTESNRERLPNFVTALENRNYMDLRPFYQRRSRWDTDRQSKLIESFIINIPVPPIFLYERDFNSYEVMDGQQRITAIKDFYTNKFTLTGLELWPELNGMMYTNLPSKVKAGIDRRSISSIVLLKESAPDDEEATFLRQVVFERLNTGGIKLEKQEIRNCLYKSPFNELLFELAEIDEFRKAWNLPLFSKEERNISISLPIHKDTFYKKMEDTEMILRFFALRHANQYRNGMRGFLDLYMSKATSFPKKDLSELAILFKDVICLADAIYGELLFRTYDPVKCLWDKAPSKAFYDAVMVGLSVVISDLNINNLIKNRAAVIQSTKDLFSKYSEGELTGRANSKGDVIRRISIFTDMINEHL
ncbi:GmrSD restriction endonuclease domain-containing protein [Aliiglaciecola lipolytica]|uniref:GmrSD restriction endonuclease domain-containing protein n=1 Tax=Aliiglaciecola lipolytica TaxID=477689 RepID=UPI001C092473|nr:DUF262 domain-containing protein [Aliiglaciecola lipolytica]MBU2877718.1 DUF262 domain-containing protein [Aliiglaciecola lipolytica]